MKQTSELLINEAPIPLIPSLACAIGVNEAIFIQQVHYFSRLNGQSGRMHDGRRWIWNTIKKWVEVFPWLSERTIERMISDLEKLGILLSKKLDSHRGNMTKFYCIDYEKLDAHIANWEESSRQNEEVIAPEGRSVESAKLEPSLTEKRLPSKTSLTHAPEKSGDEQKSVSVRQANSEEANVGDFIQTFVNLYRMALESDPPENLAREGGIALREIKARRITPQMAINALPQFFQSRWHASEGFPLRLFWKDFGKFQMASRGITVEAQPKRPMTKAERSVLEGIQREPIQYAEEVEM